MTEETKEPEASTMLGGQSERLVITGVALLYQRQTKTGWENKVRSVLVSTEEGDDEYVLKAKAERYVATHDELSDHNLVAWSTATHE